MGGKILLTYILHIFGSFLLVSSHDTEGPTVHSPLGDIKGSTMMSRKGKTIYAFRGIPYAQPPVDELRFKPPQPLTHYTETVDATESGPACPQPNKFLSGVSEDCLHINVYTTELPKPGYNPQKPILVFFHPGGFSSGTAVSELARPEYFMDQGIIFATVNYRLGSLGFLSMGTKESPGNNGLKDQVIALRWIQQNIAAFGGDPNSVTISGYSAGSVSVCLHMMSPMSKGLFHRVIAMGGAPRGNIKYPTHQLDLAEKQAQLLCCPTISPKAILGCLMNKSSIELGNSLPEFRETKFDPLWIWTPIIEPDFGQERFLTDDPNKLLQSGNFCSVPLLIGITELEFTHQAFSVLMDEDVHEEYDKNWEKMAPIAFIYERDTENSKFISRELRKFYLDDGPLENNNETAFALGQLYGDAVISFAAHRYAKLMAKKSESPVYYYKFSYKGRYSHFYYPGTHEPIGPVHLDDLLYLFYFNLSFPNITLDAPESFMVDRLNTILANFATYGDPTPYSNDAVTENLKWPRLTATDKFYVDIGDHLVIKQGLYEERFQLWEWLFPL